MDTAMDQERKSMPTMTRREDKRGVNHCHAHVEQGACARIHSHTNTHMFSSQNSACAFAKRLREGTKRATSFVFTSLVSRFKIIRRENPDRAIEERRGWTDN